MIRPAGRRPVHFVLRYYVQRGPSPPPLGNDVSLNPLRRDLLLAAARTGRQVATPPVDFLGPVPGRGVIVFKPVRDQQGRAKGWVTVAYEAHQLARMVVAHFHGLRLQIHDGAATLVAAPRAVAGSRGTLDVAGRTWTAWAWVPRAGVSAVPWLVLAFGLMLTAAVILILRQAVSREAYAMAQVERSMAAERERQAELDAERKRAEREILAINAQLERRVAERTLELRTSNTQLEGVNRELETFAYSVSHDLRAPLRAVDGFSQALLEDYSDMLGEEGRHDLERVRAGAVRMGRLIDGILQLSRLSRRPVEREPVDLSALAAFSAVGEC
ncbi:MAG: histidine kinase dimerization/phospho-acceptor domain-containing protein [Solirubrobacteraceae bacterium]